MRSQTIPRNLAFAAAIGLMIEDESASRRVADRLGMGKAEARVLMDTTAQRSRLLTLLDVNVRPSAKRKLLGSACRLVAEAWEAWHGYPSGLTMYLRRLDQTEPPVLNGHDLMEAGVPRGPLMGEILKELADARLDGEVWSREGEVALVRRRLEEC